MRILAGFMAVMLVAAIYVGCRDDVIVEPPPPVEGTYTGIYAWIPDNGEVLEQHIKWVFTPTTVLMDLDTTIQTEADRLFCDIEGRYTLGDGVDIYVPLVAGRDSSFFMNRTQKECNPDKGPYGRFQLDQSVANRVLITRRNVADSCIQRVTLFKVSDEF